MTDVSFVIEDASSFDMRGSSHDSVFTCPPYGSMEHYTDYGAENFDESSFLDWWRRVVNMSVGLKTKIFAYQIDQSHKAMMNSVLEDCGWALLDQISVGKNKLSHMNRRNGAVSKKNFEEIQVFVRNMENGVAL